MDKKFRGLIDDGAGHFADEVALDGQCIDGQDGRPDDDDRFAVGGGPDPFAALRADHSDELQKELDELDAMDECELSGLPRGLYRIENATREANEILSGDPDDGDTPYRGRR